MGAYVSWKLKEGVSPELVNQLWRKFSGEAESISPVPNGMTFYVNEHRDAIDVYDNPEFVPHLREQIKSPADIIALFPGMFNPGWGETKISGDGYCHHRLRKLKEFLTVNRLLFSEISGMDDLDRYIGYEIEDFIPGTCSECSPERSSV